MQAVKNFQSPSKCLYPLQVSFIYKDPRPILLHKNGEGGNNKVFKKASHKQ